jgi:SAM-dependent methyltransferase
VNLRRKQRLLEVAEDQVRVSAWESIYGTFTRPEEVVAQPITGLDKESGWIHRFIVEFVDRLRSEFPIAPILLAGEPARVVSHYQAWLDLSRDDITTSGLGEVDVVWNFEEEPPAELGGFRLVLSQAMFEHLIDPFRHVRDLYNTLAPGGSLIVMTHLPGFEYHRYPIDALRFFPDWFEAVASRLDAVVTGRLVGEERILYQLTKP